MKQKRRPHHKIVKKKKTKKYIGLTPRMKIMLDIIKDYIDNNKFSPSYEELKQLCGLRSKSNVHRYLHCLRERGYISFKNHLKRGIVVL
tara:strand:+ start:2745 stop:3011 length:267 start_codon:yes stop_codon:yes gene_type:complete